FIQKSTYCKATMSYSMEKSSTAVVTPASKVPHLKASPVKLEPTPIKPPCPPTGQFSLNDYSKAILNKENSTSRDQDGTLDEEFEDSGYLSLQTSQIDEEDDHVHRTITSSSLLYSAAVTRKEKTTSPKQSPFKCRGKMNSSCPVYDWSIVTKVAEDHRLDCVIGGEMGCEFVDIFSSLLSKNMRNILTKILALLGDMDLIRCKKVSRTWRKIICELHVCQRAERALKKLDVFPATHYIYIYEEEATCRLKQHESLRACRRCGSPATHSPEAQRATCTRLSCLFDFCTQCQEAFHGSTPCRVVQPRPHFPTSKSTPLMPGSKRSIRRL
uniref:ZBR-type domain-containing protein n=1 Tax=Mola mola TaxID=94237 RepID=A0A3Q3W5V6_MOLML